MLAPIARSLLRAQTDGRLVALAKQGHDAAFEEIVRRYRAPLVAFASAYEPRSAEDVVQESLGRAWRALDGSDREIELKPWLYAIVRNRALNAKRDRKDHAEIDETIDGVRRPHEIVLGREHLGNVVAAVTALPEPQRKALVASALDGRTHEQIAAELGTSPGSVRGLIHRGRSAVRTAAGSIVPLPVVVAVVENMGAGVVAAGVAGAGLTAAGKVATVAVVAVFATGSGLLLDGAIDRDRAAGDVEGNSGERRAATGSKRSAATPGPTGSATSRSRSESSGSDDGAGRSGESGRDSERERSDDASGPSESSGSSNHSGSSGSNGNSGSSGSSGSGPSGSGSSGSGSSGPGSSGSGSSGSSGSGSGDDDPEVEFEESESEAPDDDSSGHGSGSDDD